MDLTLNQMLEISNNTQELIFDDSITIDNCVHSIHQISSYVNHLKSVTDRIKKMHNICLERINSKICSIEPMKPINKKRIGTKKWNDNILNKKIQTETRHKTLSRFASNIDDSVKLCNISPDINMSVKTVKNIDMVPNSKLYWVENIKQFVIRINDILIRGNVGNTYTKTDKHMKNIIKCKFKSECKKSKCQYYHDPLELVKDNIIVDKPIIRNYTNKSWLFTPLKINEKNKNMKHLGSGDSLKLDIDKFTKVDKQIIDNEIDMLINQSMHNLLILMALSNSKNKISSKLTFLGC